MESAPFESVLGAGAMINWITVAREHVPLYEDWYNYQHLPERVSTPGFLRARRFIGTDGRDRPRLDYLTLYETTGLDVLASSEYLRRLDNPTELTRRMVPLFAEFRRAACRVSVSCGYGSAGRVVAMEIDAGTALPALRTLLADTLFPGLIAEHALLAGSLYEPDTAVSSAKNATAEGQSSAQQQQVSSAVLLAELHSGTDPDGLIAALLGRAAQAGIRISQPTPARSFELIVELRAAPTPVRRSHADSQPS
ncbi:hypothetical protein ACWDTP_10275 [Mycobacterium sp. NPDC003449]